jgi:DNA-binding transcriptional LysR family regulator
MERHFDLNALHTFAMVVHLGSISKAAATLRLPKSTISRHLGKLERQAGFAVVKRERTGVLLTVEGQRLYDAVADSIATIRSADKAYPGSFADCFWPWLFERYHGAKLH